MLQLVRRFAACAVMCESQEAAMANGESIDIAEYSTLTSTLVRVAHRIMRITGGVIVLLLIGSVTYHTLAYR